MDKPLRKRKATRPGHSALAAFEVTVYGRFQVTTEASTQPITNGKEWEGM
jgi:hypothetical protein